MVCRHTLEVLISLAKPFSEHFLPWKDPSSSKTVQASSGPASSSSSFSSFWEILLKLDQMSNSNKKGKSVARSHSNASSNTPGGSHPGEGGSEETSAFTLEHTPFGQLLGMLSSPVIRRNSVLTDKLLRLLSLISIVQQPHNDLINGGGLDKKKKEEASEDKNSASAVKKGPERPSGAVIRSEHLKLAVEVLTSKTCSEEGLEDVTALLLNLSGPEGTRDTILSLLLQGAQELGNVVRQNILDLQNELLKLKNIAGGMEAVKPQEATNDEGGHYSNVDKGAVIDRFTNEAVVISAPSKVKGGPELQLPSMNALTNKTSSQAFFLRVLKVINCFPN